MSGGLSQRRSLQEKLDRPLRGLPRDRLLRRNTRHAVDWLADLIFGRGVYTRGDEVELDHFHPDRVAYEASDWFDLRRALPRRAVRGTDVFLDFGSGKGRVVYQAARYPFARVMGVEISEKLNVLARQNIERTRHKLACPNIDLVTMDAREFDIPSDVTIAYLYHPFSGETFETVIANIIGSLDRCPRQFTLIYQVPWREEHILATGRFRLVRTLKGRPRDPRRIAVYSSLPAG